MSRKIERIFLTAKETQAFLNVGHSKLYRLMKQGLASHKIGGKRVFLKEDIAQWIKEHRVEPLNEKKDNLN